MSNFIPGKWICKDGYIFAETGETIASVFNPTDIDTNEANARLIAAAPEMYNLPMECADELDAVGLPTLSRECYELISRIDGKEDEA